MREWNEPGPSGCIPPSVPDPPIVPPQRTPAPPQGSPHPPRVSSPSVPRGMPPAGHDITMPQLNRFHSRKLSAAFSYKRLQNAPAGAVPPPPPPLSGRGGGSGVRADASPRGAAAPGAATDVTVSGRSTITRLAQKKGQHDCSFTACFHGLRRSARDQGRSLARVVTMRPATSGPSPSFKFGLGGVGSAAPRAPPPPRAAKASRSPANLYYTGSIYSEGMYCSRRIRVWPRAPPPLPPGPRFALPFASSSRTLCVC